MTRYDTKKLIFFEVKSLETAITCGFSESRACKSSYFGGVVRTLMGAEALGL